MLPSRKIKSITPEQRKINFSIEHPVAWIVASLSWLALSAIFFNLTILRTYNPQVTSLLISSDPIALVGQNFHVVVANAVAMLAIVIFANGPVMAERTSHRIALLRIPALVGGVAWMFYAAATQPLGYLALPAFVLLVERTVDVVVIVREKKTATIPSLMGLLMMSVTFSVTYGVYVAHARASGGAGRVNVYTEDRNYINAALLYGSSSGYLILQNDTVLFIPSDKIVRSEFTKRDLNKTLFGYGTPRLY